MWSKDRVMGLVSLRDTGCKDKRGGGRGHSHQRHYGFDALLALFLAGSMETGLILHGMAAPVALNMARSIATPCVRNGSECIGKALEVAHSGTGWRNCKHSDGSSPAETATTRYCLVTPPDVLVGRNTPF